MFAKLEKAIHITITSDKFYVDNPFILHFLLSGD